MLSFSVQLRRHMPRPWMAPAVFILLAAIQSVAQPGTPSSDASWIRQMGCAQCHTDLDGQSAIRPQAPDLGSAGLRYRTSYLLEFLQKPQRVRRHIGRARMPDFHLNEAEALALALYLEQQRAAPTQWPPLPDALRDLAERPGAVVARAEFDRTLASGLTCLTCHTLNGQGGPLGPELSDVGHQLHPGWIQSYLVAPAMYGVPTNVMPAQFYHLSPDKIRFEPAFPQAEQALTTVVAFLKDLGTQRRATLDQKLATARTAHPESTPAMGERLFRSLNCAACHRHPNIEPREHAAPALASEGLRAKKSWLEQYLRSPKPLRRAGYHPGDGSRMPNYHLAADEVSALTDELMSRRTPLPVNTNFTPLPLSAFSREKAIRLLQEKYSCLGCHRLGEKGGAIGPDLSSASDRLQPAYVFSIIAEPRQIAPHSIMPRIPMPRETVELLARCLIMGGWTNAPEKYFPTMELSAASILVDKKAQEQSPRMNYMRHCAACHGVDGRGDGFNAPFLLTAKATAFTSREYLALRPDDTLFDAIHSGARVVNRSPLMPAWGASFSGQQIRELVGILRGFCQCDAPPWSRDGSAASP